MFVENGVPRNRAAAGSWQTRQFERIQFGLCKAPDAISFIQKPTRGHLCHWMRSLLVTGIGDKSAQLADMPPSSHPVLLGDVRQELGISYELLHLAVLADRFEQHAGRALVVSSSQTHIARSWRSFHPWRPSAPMSLGALRLPVSARQPNILEVTNIPTANVSLPSLWLSVPARNLKFPGKV
jgi:hypothetical protein